VLPIGTVKHEQNDGICRVIVWSDDSRSLLRIVLSAWLEGQIMIVMAIVAVIGRGTKGRYPEGLHYRVTHEAWMNPATVRRPLVKLSMRRLGM